MLTNGSQLWTNFNDGMVSESNMSDLYYNDTLLYELSFKRMLFNLPVIVILFVVMIIGLFGNILVILFYSLCSTKTPANFYILVLASLDITTCACCVPYHLYKLLYPYQSSFLSLCLTERFLENISNLGSGFILLAVASERYNKIKYPFVFYGRRKAKYITIVIFFVTVAFSWPQAFISREEIVEIGKDKVVSTDCLYSSSGRDGVYVLIFYGFLYMVYLISFCAFLFFYGNISFVIIKQFIQLKKNRTVISQVTKNNNDANVSRDLCRKVSGMKMKSSKTTMCLTTVTATVMLGYIPFLTIITLRSIGTYFQPTLLPSGEYFHYGSSAAVDLACTICVRSYFINCAINPIIYSLVNPAFRFRTVTTKLKGVLIKRNSSFHLRSSS